VCVCVSVECIWLVGWLVRWFVGSLVGCLVRGGPAVAVANTEQEGLGSPGRVWHDPFGPEASPASEEEPEELHEAAACCIGPWEEPPEWEG
jgi:hypothetical protein